MTFRIRLALTATAIAVLVAALITSVSVVRSMREAREALLVSGRNGVEHLAADVAPPVRAGDRAEAARTARSYLLALPEVASVTVYRGRAPLAIEGDRPPLAGPAPSISAGEVRWQEAAGGLLFQAPVVLPPPAAGTAAGGAEPEVIGVAEVVLSLAPARARLRTTVLLNAVLLAIGVGLAVLLSAWSARRLARPVRRLVAAAEEVGAGRLDLRVPVQAHDELGVLTERFNHMIRELRRAAEERAGTERELREHAAALRDADRRKDEFLAMLAHELRNPLAPIANAAFVISRAPGSEGARRAAEILQRQVRHMSRLIDDLLDVSRIERGKITLRRSATDLAEVVRRTAQDYRGVFEDAGVTLELRLPAAPVAVDGDETRLVQVLGNLLQNAAKFTPAGGRTTVTLEHGDGRARLRVRDTGAGICPSVRARLFQPFAQADRSLARTGGGLGLGLALVKGLVELHDGSVEARSEGLGHGAEFVVRLPLERRERPQAEPSPAPSQEAPPPGRVLVIEDNVDWAETLKMALEMNGQEVEVALTGPEGLEKARRLHPDVVLCDIGLPGMDGYQVARNLRGDPELRSIPLVAVSGYAAPEDVERAREAGFDSHFAKPPDLELLKRTMAQMRPRAPAPDA